MIKDSKEWVFGDLIHLDTETLIAGKDMAAGQFKDGYIELEAVSINQKSIGQFTGLTDKNGVPIYEGDIVRWGVGFTGYYDMESWHRYAIVGIDPDLQFKIIYYLHSTSMERNPSNRIIHFGSFMYSDTHLYLEIIGNIHEHPHLLC